MITIITGILIVLYCLYQLLDIDMFIKKFHGAELENTIDSFVFLGIIIWLIVQFFMQSAIISLIPFITMLFKINNKSLRKQKQLHAIVLLTIIVVVSFILLNKMYFNFNFWTLNF